MDNRVLIERFIQEHQYKLFGFIFNRVNNREDSEDIYQTVMEKVLLKVNSLRDSKKLNSWVLSITSNEINSYYKSRQLIENTDFLDIAEPEEYDDFAVLEGKAINSLSSKLRDVFSLRFYNNLSYKQISLICNISEKTVKSRLFDAKKHIGKIIPNLYHYSYLTNSYFEKQKEKIVMDLKNVEIGSYVFTRLSLEKQVEFCISSVNNKEFSDSLLEEIGKIKNGKEFVLIFHSKVLMKELVSFLNLCDRYTEKRVIEELEALEPEIAQNIKNSMFVFEDLILCDDALISELFNRVDERLAARALKVTIARVKNHIFNAINSSKRENINKLLNEIHAGWEEGLKAQWEIVESLKEMDLNGEVEVKRLQEQDKETIELVLRNR